MEPGGNGGQRIAAAHCVRLAWKQNDKCLSDDEPAGIGQHIVCDDPRCRNIVHTRDPINTVAGDYGMNDHGFTSFLPIVYAGRQEIPPKVCKNV